MLKRIISVFLIIAFGVLLLSGCGKSEEKNIQTDVTTTELETTKDTVNRDVSQKTTIKEADSYKREFPNNIKEDEDSTENTDSMETTHRSYLNESTPFEQKYWVIFREGYRDGRIEASTVDSTLSDNGLSFIWNGSLELNDASGSDECEQYYLDENGQWVFIGTYGRLSDYATEIIASNLNVVDQSGNIVVNASSYSNVDLNELTQENIDNIL